jgi:type IV secretory pathway TrbD component
MGTDFSETTRNGIAAFAVAIAVSLLTRAYSISSSSATDAVVYAGLLFGAGLWLVGCYYAYVSIRTDPNV